MAIVEKRLQLTLAVLKPDMLVNPFRAKAVKESILNEGFLIIRSRLTKWQWEKAASFYSEHRGRFFYNRLLASMTGGVMNPLILAKQNAIADWRGMMGSAKVYQSLTTHPETLRVQYGFTDTRNGLHGADSDSSVEREIGFFFPDFEVARWMQDEEPLFRERHQVEYDPNTGIHKLIPLDYDITGKDPTVNGEAENSEQIDASSDDHDSEESSEDSNSEEPVDTGNLEENLKR